MTGGLLQLKAYGSENIYLNANPQLSFFRSVYRRHTNFAMENFEIPYNGTIGLTPDSNSTFLFKIKRYADLLGPIYLSINLPAIYSSEHKSFQWIKNIGSNIIKTAGLYIGGQKIVELTGDTINNFHRLSRNYSTNLNYNQMIGHLPELYNPLMKNRDGKYVYRNSDGTAPSIQSQRLYIPLCFYFCFNSGLYLPLVALQNTEVEIILELRKISELYTLKNDKRNSIRYGKRVNPNPNDSSESLLSFIKEKSLRLAFTINLDANYLFLDNDERLQFSKLPHEYLIEQYQYKNIFGVIDHTIIDMNFFHPTKEIIFYARKSDCNCFNEWSNFSNIDKYANYFLEGGLNNTETRPEFELNYMRPQIMGDIMNNSIYLLKTAKFKMNGQDRTRDLPEQYYRNVQVFQYHLGSNNYQFDEYDHFNIFTFSLEPDNFQPSGSCNLTNLKSFQLDLYTTLPPIFKTLKLGHYILETDDAFINVSYRNPLYSNRLIDNVYNSYLNIYSLDSHDNNNKKLYGTFLEGSINYNIAFYPVQYTLVDGCISNNIIILDNSKMYFYNPDDIYFEKLIKTINVRKGEIYFIYLEKEIQLSYNLLFISINTEVNKYEFIPTNNTISQIIEQDFDTYYSQITQSEFDNLVSIINTNNTRSLKGLFKTEDQIIMEEIQNNILSEITRSKNLTDVFINSDQLQKIIIPSNIFTLYFVDFVNKKIYGKIKINEKNTTTNQISLATYYCTMSYTNIYSTHNTYIIIPSDNVNYFKTFFLNDISLKIPIADKLLLQYSLIVFQLLTTNTQDPNDLKNYMWKYDLTIEARNYNLLRIVNGQGALAYST
jgi:hypothetical protein